ncbi:MAG: isoprenylcysteine carboxylmethyltransferase family protein [Caldilineaceae bacterium]
MSEQKLRFTPQVVLQLVLVVVVLPFLPLLITQQWGWWQAWAYAGISIAGFILSHMLAAQRDPSLIAERARFADHKDAESWDKYLAPAVALGGALIPLMAGLDVRLAWAPRIDNIWIIIVSLILVTLGYVIGAYALMENRFFSGVVRIQQDRGHHVITTGPYGWVRHPGYAAAALTFLATPFLLGSWCAIGPAVLVVAVLVIRTRLEDETLQAKLKGYQNYAHHVRYRLLPGVW